MALKNLCGFETGDQSEATLAGTASIVLSPVPGAWSIYALRCNPTTTGTGYASIGSHDDGLIDVTMGLTEIHVGFRFRCDTAPSADYELIALADGGTPFELRMTHLGNLECYQGVSMMAAGNTPLNDGQWHYLLWNVDSSGNTVLFVDGNLEWVASTGLTTPGFDVLKLGKAEDRNGESVDYFFDDVIIADVYLDEESPGDVCVERLAPNADGTSHTVPWEIGAGTGDHYEQVEEVPHDGDTTYLVDPDPPSGSDNELILCESMGSAASILAVKGFAIVKRHGGTNGNAFTYLQTIGAMRPQSSSAATTATYLMHGLIVNTDPDGGNWTEAAVNGLGVGVGNTGSTGANRNRCTAMGIMVGYKPSGWGPIPPDPPDGDTGVAPSTTTNICGFELGGEEELLDSDGTFSIQGTTTRGAWSAYALRVNPTGSDTGWVSLGLPIASNRSTRANYGHSPFGRAGYPGYLRFYFRFASDISAEEKIAQYVGIADQVIFTLGSDEKIRVYHDASELCASSALTAGTWYRVEWKQLEAGWELKIDGTTVDSDTWTFNFGDSVGVGGAFFAFGKYTNTNSADVDFAYDDIAYRQSGWCGEGQVIRLDVNDDIATGSWTRNSGTSDYYTYVDDVPHDGNTTYLSNSVYQDGATFGVETMPGVASILACKAMATVLSGGAYYARAGVLLGENGQTSWALSTALTELSGGSYHVFGAVAEENPVTSSAWQRSEVENAAVMVASFSASYGIRCTSLCLMVDYVPGGSEDVAGQPGAVLFRGAPATVSSIQSVATQPGAMFATGARPAIAASGGVSGQPGLVSMRSGQSLIDNGSVETVDFRPGSMPMIGARSVATGGAVVVARSAAAIFPPTRMLVTSTPGAIVAAPGQITLRGAPQTVGTGNLIEVLPGVAFRGNPTAGVVMSPVVSGQPGAERFTGTRSRVDLDPNIVSQPGWMPWIGLRPQPSWIGNAIIVCYPGWIPRPAPRPLVASSSVGAGQPGALLARGSPSLGVSSSIGEARPGWMAANGTRPAVASSSVVTACVGAIAPASPQPIISRSDSVIVRPGAPSMTAGRPTVSAGTSILVRPGVVALRGPSNSTSTYSIVTVCPGSMQGIGSPSLGVSSSLATARVGWMPSSGTRSTVASGSVVAARTDGVTMAGPRPTVPFGASIVVAPGLLPWLGPRPVIGTSPSILGQPGYQRTLGTRPLVAASSVVSATAGASPHVGTRSLAASSSIVTARAASMIMVGLQPPVTATTVVASQPGVVRLVSGKQTVTARGPGAVYILIEGEYGQDVEIVGHLHEVMP